MGKIYVDIYSRGFDSIYYRAYETEEKAKEDEGYTKDIVFDGSFSLEEFPQINMWMKLCIATQLIIEELRKATDSKPINFEIVNCKFDGKNVKEELERLIMQNYHIANFGKWRVN